VKTLESEVREFTDRLKQGFAQEIASSPREFKKRVLKLVRRTLPLRRGRPANPQIEAALILLKQGKSVREVLREQVTGFDQLDTYGRYLTEKALRQALSRRGWRATKQAPRPRFAASHSRDSSPLVSDQSR